MGWLLEATAELGGTWVVLQEVRQCTGDDRQQWSGTAARRRSRSSPEKKTVAATAFRRSGALNWVLY